MRSLQETAESNIQTFKNSAVGKAEPLQDSITLVEEDPKLVAKRYYAYYRVVKDLFELTPEELATIKAVNEKLGTHRGADEFVDEMGDKKEQFLEQMRQVGNLDKPNNQTGMAELERMMNNAWETKQAEPNWTPKDGDPRADNVIWGFVKGATSPETDVDFTLCHGLERTMTTYLADKEYTAHKDWLLCALNDVITLRGLKGEGYEAELLPFWSKPRPEGLGWVSQRRLDAYKKELDIK